MTFQVGNNRNTYFNACGATAWDNSLLVSGDLTNNTPLASIYYIGWYNCTDSTVEYIIYSVQISTDDTGNTLTNPLNNSHQNSNPSSPNLIELSLCPNLQLDGTETCDDGNAASGDGCSSTCHEEAGWVWEQQGGDSVWVEWGNGVREWPEECDDGGQGDGCSGRWEVEDEWVCTGGSVNSQDTWVRKCSLGKCHW